MTGRGRGGALDATRQALGAFQARHGLEASGEPDGATLDKLTSPGSRTISPDCDTPRKSRLSPRCERRWGWQAAASVFEDVVPAVIKYWRHRGENPRTKVAEYLAHIGIPTQVVTKRNEIRKILHRNLVAGEKIAYGSLTKLQRARVRKEFAQLVVKEGVKDFQTSFDKKAASLDRLHGYFRPISGFVRFTFGSLVEGVNVCAALSDYDEARRKGEADGWRAFALAGAGAEMLEHAASCVEQLKRQGGVGKTVIRSAGAFLGVVSSLSDFMEYEEATLEASMGSYDYGKASGHGVQALGAGVGAVGGGLALAEGLGVGSVAGGILGGWLLGAGAVLVIGGTLLAEMLKLDDWETFAQGSFLGSVGADPWNGGKKVPWSAFASLPTRDPREEANALLMLEATFQIDCFCSIGSDLRLVIRPGLVYPDSKFEILLETSWRNWSKNRFELEVDLKEDDVVQSAGPALLKRDSAIERDRDGNVTAISINVEDPTLPGDRLGQYQSVRAWVRLNLDGKVFVPDDEDHGVAAALPLGVPRLSRGASEWKARTEWEAGK